MELLNFKIDLSLLEGMPYPMAYLVNEFLRRKRARPMKFIERKRTWTPVWIIFALILLIASILYLLLIYLLLDKRLSVKT